MHYLKIVIALVAAMGSSGCSLNMIGTKPYAESPGVLNTNGREFCSELESHASSLSGANAVGGWIFAGLAAGTATAGTIVTTANAASEGGGNKAVGIAGASLIASTALMLPAALTFFSRADAATELGSEANKAMLEEKDRDAYGRCVSAKAAWIASRAEANAIIREALQKAQKDKKQAELDAAKETQAAEKKALEAAAKEVEATQKTAEADAKIEEAEVQKRRADEADKKLQQVKEGLKPKKNAVPPEVWRILPPDPH